LTSLISSSTKIRKTQKNGAVALLEKFALQFQKLGRAKTVTTYTAWLSTAEKLENLSKGTKNEKIFRALRMIATLIRVLFRARKDENTLHNPAFFFESDFISSIPPDQTHPAVRALWDFFCRAGEQKFGAEWGEAARICQLSFISEESQDALRAQYKRFIKSYWDDDTVADLIPDIVRSSSVWTEQELYILNSVYVLSFSSILDMDLPVAMQSLEAFNMLSRIGRKWRPEAPWVNNIQRRFDSLLDEYPLDFISLVITNIPYEALSPRSLIKLSLLDGTHLKKIEKTLSNRLPLSISKEDVAALGGYLSIEFKASSLQGVIYVLNTLLSQSDTVSILTKLGCNILEESGNSACFGASPQMHAWTAFSNGGFSEEAAKLLPPDNFVGCFCRLCSNMPEYSISSDEEKIEAFLTALPQDGIDIDKYDYVLFFLLTWPDIDPKFIVRLFEKSYIFCNKENRMMLGEIWLDLAEIIGRMTNKKNRGMVALGILKLVAWNKKKTGYASFKDAMKRLERYVNPNDLHEIIPVPKKAKKPTEKTEKTPTKTGKQGILPF
jgi:hypothetical protein